MNLNKIYPVILVCVLSLAVLSPAMAKKKQEFPEVTVDGLELVKQTKSGVVYAKPGASLTTYKRVKLLAPAVAFKKNWERDQRHSNSITAKRLSPKDIDKIKTTLATEFNIVFTKTLEEAGYELTDEIAEDVMIIRPAIINLDVNAPNAGSNSRDRVYVDSAGEMTLYLELYDSATSDLIVKAMSRKADNAFGGFYTWANSSTNKIAAEKILSGWAKILVNALNESKSIRPAE